MRKALGPRRGQYGDGHWPGLASSLCCARGSQSHIKEMLQLVLNWEVSQAAVRTGMIRGALCVPKQGQTSQRQRMGFLEPHRKNLTEELRTRALGIGGSPDSRTSLQTWFTDMGETSSSS